MKSSHRVQKEPSSSRRRMLLLVLVLPSVIAIGTAWVLKNKPYASDITVSLTVSRFAFELEKASLGDEFVRSLNVGSVAMSNVDRIEFGAHRVRLADPKRYDLSTNSYPENAWKEIIADQPRVVLTGETAPGLPFVRIDPTPPERMLQLDPVRVKVPSRIVLEVAEENIENPEVLTGPQPNISNRDPIEIKATIQPQEGVFNVVAQHGPIQIQTHDLFIPGGSVRSSNGPATLSVEFNGDNAKVTITPKSGPLDLVFAPLSNLGRNMLPDSPLQLSRPEFLVSIPNATPHPAAEQASASLPYTSSILSEGQVTNHDFPDKTAKIPPRAFLYFSDEATLRLTNLSVLPSGGGIQIQLQGHPSAIYSTSDLSGSDRVPYQMTLLDYLMESKPTRMFFAIGVWFVTTTLAAYRLFKEIQKETGA